MVLTIILSIVLVGIFVGLYSCMVVAKRSDEIDEIEFRRHLRELKEKEMED